ncbi:MAG: sigma-70 family RNA polymerase sigma factor [Ruminiclostridium sp.]|nr:sigma-70 family RNA polymerase sigma factor [Ruminiclostridium sp.]
MNDDKIIQLYLNRDETAIEQTNEKYGKLCKNIATEILKTDEDGEECVNTTYLKIWNSIPPTIPDSFKAFLIKTVRNTALTLAVKLGKQKTDYIYDELEEVISSKETPETLMDNRNIATLLNAFLDKQKKRNRDIFVARYYFNMSTKSIAFILGMEHQAVRSQLLRTRTALRTYLKENGIEV